MHRKSLIKPNYGHVNTKLNYTNSIEQLNENNDCKKSYQNNKLLITKCFNIAHAGFPQ